MKLLTLPILLAFACLCPPTHSFAQSPLGTWVSIDDESGKEKSQVYIYEVNGKQYGKIVRLITAPNHTCDKCTDYRKDQPILNMIIIEDMVWANGLGQGGRALYPKQGKWYPLKYWLKEGDPNTLVLRGSWGPFFRTQEWRRVK